MSTIHHTAISTGAAANASTINNPLGELDAAIETVDNRVSTIIASSGTSSTEVVDARGTYAVLSERLNDLTFASDVLLVDSAFTTDAAAKRFETIGAAMSACSGGETVLIAPGTYAETVVIPANNITLRGSGQPSFDAASGRLVGGTILTGRIRCGVRVGLTISDLGVDLVGVDHDCIESALTTETAVWRKFKNLTLLGNGFDSYKHGLYGDGNYLTIDNIHCIRCHHGIAIHGKYVNISNCIFEQCAGSSLIIKAKISGVDVVNVNVTNLIIRGDATSADYKFWGGPLVVQHANNQNTQWISISNVTATDCVNGCVQITPSGISTGTVKDVSLTNISSGRNHNLAGVGDFWIYTGERITFSNCRSTDRLAGNGFSLDAAGNATNVYLYDCAGDASGSGNSAGAFQVAEINRQSAALVAQRNQFTIAQGLMITKAVANNTATNIAELVAPGASLVVGACLVSLEITGGTSSSGLLYALTFGWSSEAATKLAESLYNHSAITLVVTSDTTNKKITFNLTQVNPTAVACTVRMSVLPLGAYWDNALTLIAL